jgi:hypothetical protein
MLLGLVFQDVDPCAHAIHMDIYYLINIWRCEESK